MFKDRQEAGRRLAERLEEYRGSNAIVLAIPRGGAITGYEIAKELQIDFSLLVSRKLPSPDNPEAGFGAIAEDGSIYLAYPYANYVADNIKNKIIKKQREVIKEKVKLLRKNTPLDIEGKTVILTDDGIAMGSTMQVSVNYCRNHKARWIVVAVPVSGWSAKKEFNRIADEFIVLETPEHFLAVAQSYENWHNVPDEEVLTIMEKFEQEKSVKSIK